MPHFPLSLLICFSLKWENVSGVTFLTFLAHLFLMMLCAFLYRLEVAGSFLCYLVYFWPVYEINRRNNCRGRWLGVDKSGSSKLSLYFLPCSFYNLCLESPEWEDFAQTLQHGCTPHFLPADLTYWFTVVILRCFEINI